MFNDDESFTFKKMHEFSTADGFVEVAECMAGMIKYVANEPSVGLFYIQKHIQNAVPNVVSLKNKVADKSREMILHTEDAEDSISVVRSMREYGHPIADGMIKDIERSLSLVSATHPKRGFISSSTSAFNLGRSSSSSSSWGPMAWTRKPRSSSSSQLQEDDEKSVSYFSNVIKSAKDTASNFRWPQMELNELSQAEGETPVPSSWIDTDGKESSSMAGSEIDELPLSTQPADEELLSLAENFDEFTADKEAKLELWLAETRN